MSSLLKKGDLKKILAAKTLKKVVIAVAALDGQEVEITELTARQRMRLGSMMLKGVPRKGQKTEMDFSRLADMMMLAAMWGLGLDESDLPMLDANGELVQEVGQAVMALSGMNVGAGSSAEVPNG